MKCNLDKMLTWSGLLLGLKSRSYLFWEFTAIGNPPECLVGFARKLIEATVVGSYERPSTDELPLRCLTRINAIQQCVMRAYADHPRAGSSSDLLTLLKRELSEAPSFAATVASACTCFGWRRPWMAPCRPLSCNESSLHSCTGKMSRSCCCTHWFLRNTVSRHAA